MYRPPASPGAPQSAGRFPSPAPYWGFPGARSPYGGTNHRGRSPRGSPVYSPGPHRGYWDGSPSGFGSGSRGFGGQMRRRGGSFQRPQSFSPASAHNPQAGSSECPVEKYFSPAMLQDPWAALLAAAADRQTS